MDDNAGKQHAFGGRMKGTTGQRANDLRRLLTIINSHTTTRVTSWWSLHIFMDVLNPILSTNKDTTRPIGTTGQGGKTAGRSMCRGSESTTNVVQTQIKLVVRQLLLYLVNVLPSRRLDCTIQVGVLKFQRGEDGIVVPIIKSDGVKDDGPRPVRLEGTGDGRPATCVSIQNVDKLALLDGRYHHGTSLGIGGQILSRRAATAARMAECRTVQNFGRLAMGTRFKVQDSQVTTIGTYRQNIPLPAR
mmetsp:Transcript_15478/g.33673  ORF Transcript_15478/g.33673 Transcript_15478/m.33673 type:complete len:246 (-) Transcript_15478:351-1088(-)